MRPDEAMKEFGFAPQDLSVDKIKQKFRELALKNHPDRPHNHDKKEEATENKDLLWIEGEMYLLRQEEECLSPVSPLPSMYDEFIHEF